MILLYSDADLPLKCIFLTATVHAAQTKVLLDTHHKVIKSAMDLLQAHVDQGNWEQVCALPR